MKAWENFLLQLEREFGKNVISNWLRPLRILRFDAGNLYLEAKDYFQALWFEEHIRPKAEAHLTNNNDRKIKIHLSIANNVLASAKQPNARSAPRKKEFEEKKPFRLLFDDLNPTFTFHSLYCSQDNLVPFKLISTLCGFNFEKKIYETSISPDLGSLNPIYLFGPEGTGKSHLLVALTKNFQERGLQAVYIKAETFTQHVVDAIRAGEMSAFRQTYRNIDVLLMDDVHLLSRKTATQEELFHTFNALHLAGKQIVLAANCSPQELQLIEPRLISRFEWGISLPLKPLNPIDMRHMLDLKTELLQFPLVEKIKEFLIANFSTNPKKLLSALDTLILRAHLQSKNGTFSSTTLTLANAKYYLSDLLREMEQQAITPEKILRTVAEHYSIPQEEILGKSQSRDCVYPRQVVMFLCRLKLKMPFMKIGEIFDRDHSTVMTSIKRIKNSLDSHENELVNTINLLDQKLQ